MYLELCCFVAGVHLPLAADRTGPRRVCYPSSVGALRHICDERLECGSGVWHGGDCRTSSHLFFFFFSGRAVECFKCSHLVLESLSGLPSMRHLTAGLGRACREPTSFSLSACGCEVVPVHRKVLLLLPSRFSQFQNQSVWRVRNSLAPRVHWGRTQVCCRPERAFYSVVSVCPSLVRFVGTVSF